ncbi:hypothetical protein DMC30DRAFT_300858 [Rhodotorula diobovata]|uniref:Uncharacterized protein n=1 Tax=Rhodotorula diobovata TaxID=5288 RepID=A0A5C5FRU8_9BASI|nr:hypothetical protein DMC30DRAFT_300858 [Rhodotorula diobovata]
MPSGTGKTVSLLSLIDAYQYVHVSSRVSVRPSEGPGITAVCALPRRALQARIATPSDNLRAVRHAPPADTSAALSETLAVPRAEMGGRGGASILGYGKLSDWRHQMHAALLERWQAGTPVGRYRLWIAMVWLDAMMQERRINDVDQMPPAWALEAWLRGADIPQHDPRTDEFHMSDQHGVRRSTCTQSEGDGADRLSLPRGRGHGPSGLDPASCMFHTSLTRTSKTTPLHSGASFPR